MFFFSRNVVFRFVYWNVEGDFREEAGRGFLFSVYLW